MTIWDVGGQDKIRQLWRHYYDHTDCLVWVLDSADESRLTEARNELHSVMSDDALRNAALLVYANKQDLPQAMSTDKIADALGLRSLPHRTPWYIQGTSAVTGEGLTQGLDWVHTTLRESRYSKRAG